MEITSGILISAFKVCELLNNKQGTTLYDDKIGIIPGTSIEKTIDFLDFISMITLKEKKISLNINLYNNNNYGTDALKYLLKIYYQTINPPPFWLRNAYKGRAELIGMLSSDIEDSDFRSCLDIANLLCSNDDISIVWWQDIMEFSRRISKDRKTEIGNEGEMLSMTYERQRGIQKPELKSIESYSLGYDILSYVNPGNRDDGKRLLIEVKTSEKEIKFSNAFITRNEWEKASNNYNNYIFHLWDISERKKPKLAIIDKEEMLINAPINQNFGKHEGFKVPFKSFYNNFRVQNFY